MRMGESSNTGHIVISPVPVAILERFPMVLAKSTLPGPRILYWTTKHCGNWTWMTNTWIQVDELATGLSIAFIFRTSVGLFCRSSLHAVFSLFSVSAFLVSFNKPTWTSCSTSNILYRNMVAVVDPCQRTASQWTCSLLVRCIWCTWFLFTSNYLYWHLVR